MGRRSLTTMALFVGLIASVTAEAANVQVWTMAASGNGNLFRIDEPSNTISLIGAILDPINQDVGAGWSTDAITPDGTLYFLRRGETTDHIFKLDSNNIIVSSGGVIQNVQAVASTGLGGNLDGLTGGPDGNLYFTAYDNSIATFAQNGLFRYNIIAGTTDFVGTFANNRGPGGFNSFYTDLSFDPITGDLVGTGTDSNGSFIPWRLGHNQVIGQINQSWSYVDAFSSWSPSLSDGLAYNISTGDLYASGDSGGVYNVDRNTGAVGVVLAGSDTAFGGQIGTDLAILPVNEVAPEPSTIISASIASLIGLGAFLRGRRRSA